MNSKQIIGAIVQRPAVLETILDHIKPSMLSEAQARLSLQTMILMQNNGEPIDMATVSRKCGQISGSYLVECIDACPSPANSGYYAKEQYNFWARNELKSMMSRIEYDGNIDDILSKTMQIVSDFELNCTDRKPSRGNAEQIVEDYLRHISDIKAGKTKILKCNTPGLYNDQNPERSTIPYWIGGLYVVVSSYSSAGKSAYLTNLAVREAEAGANVVIFSNEMGANGYAERIAGYYSNIPYGHIRHNLLTDNQKEKIDEALIRFSQLPIKIYDRVRSASEIKKTLKRLSYSQQTDIVLVDYLQNLVDKAADVKAQLDTASKSLMTLAQDMNLSVVAASQIDNATAKGHNENQNFMAPKGSGDIAADANVFIDLSRDALNQDDLKCRTINFATKKNRDFSHVGMQRLYFNKSFSRIESENNLKNRGVLIDEWINQ